MNHSQQSVQVDKATHFIGNKRDQVYYGYFENAKVLQWFTHILSSSELQQRRQDIEEKGYCEQLGIGDGNGNLTNFLKKNINISGTPIYTTSTDISQDQLNGNLNHDIHRQVLDISTQNPSSIFHKKFDLISTRSVFHYMGSAEAIKDSLIHINSSLSNIGKYLLQEVAYDNEIEIALIKNIFALIGKPVVFLTKESLKNLVSQYFTIQEPSLSRYYQMSLKNAELYKKTDSNFSKNELFQVFKNGRSSITDQGPGLFVEQDEFLKRYNHLYRPEEEQTRHLKDAIVELIKKVDEEHRPNILLRDNRFGIHFPYTTLICSK